MFNETKCPPRHRNITMAHDMKSLEESLIYFGLTFCLQELDKSLEEVRSGKRSKEDHERLLKTIDKDMQKLSLIYHPDKVKCKGGSKEEITEAQNVQSILNKTRTVLNILTASFLKDINTVHKYEFYAVLSLSFLGNEDGVKNCIYKIRSKIGMLSEMKHEYTTLEIRSFLVCSRCCITSYFEKNVKDFEKYKDLALFHLKCYIKGYEKLYLKIDEVVKESTNDKLHTIGSIMHKIGSNCKREIALLKELQKTAEMSPKNFNFFSLGEPIDSYFVLPFVSYINVILMCNVVMKKLRFFGRWRLHDLLSFLMRSYYLVSYYFGNHHRELALQILAERGITMPEAANRDPMRGGAINEAFDFMLKEVTDKMEGMFKVDNYVKRNCYKKESVLKVDNCDGGSKESSSEGDIKVCMAMIHKFGKMNNKFSQDIDNLKMKREEVEKKFEECDTLLKQIKKRNK